MKKILKWAGIIFLAGITVTMIYAFLGKEQTLNLRINEADLSDIPDGKYTGDYDCYRWSNTVVVTVKNHRITAIESVRGPEGREDIRQHLTDRIIDAQKLQVDTVSGATADKNAFLKAVENALTYK